MFRCKIFSPILYKQISNMKVQSMSRKNIQISIIGAANSLGTNLATLVKQNIKIHRLELYDEDISVKGLAMELNHIPGGPKVRGWTENELNSAIKDSNLILMTYRGPNEAGSVKEQMFASNVPVVHKVCRAIIDNNPDTFIAIATNPVNAIVPFVSAIMDRYDCYDSNKIFGVTNIDSAITRALTADALKIDPVHVSVPIIGGHSDETIVPLFSKMLPVCPLNPHKVDTLTRLIRESETKVVIRKNGQDSPTLGTAVAINDFIQSIVDALYGATVTINTFSANPNFETRFFSGPVTIGQYGITQVCGKLELSDYETFLLRTAIPIIKRDVKLGENNVQFFEKSQD